MQQTSIKEWADKTRFLTDEKTKILSEAKSPAEAMKFSLMNANVIFKFNHVMARIQYLICEKLNVSPSSKISIFKNKKEAKVFSEKHIKPKNAN